LPFNHCLSALKATAAEPREYNMHNKEISSEKVTFLGGGKKKESSKRKRSE
jgi:hypothetical protein